MKKSELGLILLTIAICGVVVAGEYVTYGNVFHYDSSADATGDYSIYDSGTHRYDAILSDNGAFVSATKFYVYYDEGYGSVVHDVQVEVGAKALTQDYFLSQLVNNLRYYSVTDVTYVNATQLADVVSDLSSAGACGLVVASGALPRTVYSGSSTDPLLAWVHAGGKLYWVGESIGRYVGNADGTKETIPGGESLFTGVAGCLNETTGSGRAYSEVTSNQYRSALSLKNNNVKYAVDSSALTVPHLQIGYLDGTYSSTTLLKSGDGMVCIVAGDYSNNQRMDLATVIASGLGPSSVMIDHVSGTVARGTVHGAFTGVPAVHGELGVFLYLGGDFSVYGKSYGFPSA
ncbi:MAG: hypothetical protein MJZ38_05075 [archaeon]|nr:hypothetical protein [archaeon]